MPLGDRPARTVRLDQECFAHLRYWAETNPRLLIRIFRLMEECLREPSAGTGKPEPLKHVGPGVWSRRIDDEHRLVYRVERTEIVFLRARHHYR